MSIQHLQRAFAQAGGRHGRLPWLLALAVLVLAWAAPVAPDLTIRQTGVHAAPAGKLAVGAPSLPRGLAAPVTLDADRPDLLDSEWRCDEVPEFTVLVRAVVYTRRPSLSAALPGGRALSSPPFRLFDPRGPPIPA
jgi:hypothetical protein